MIPPALLEAMAEASEHAYIHEITHQIDSGSTVPDHLLAHRLAVDRAIAAAERAGWCLAERSLLNEMADAYDEVSDQYTTIPTTLSQRLRRAAGEGT